MTPKFKLNQQVWIFHSKSSLQEYDLGIRTGFVKNISLYNLGTEDEKLKYTVEYLGGYGSTSFDETDLIETLDDVLDLIQTSVRTYYTT
jgi:hypothetical protein